MPVYALFASFALAHQSEDSVDAYVKRQMDQQHIPGLSLLVLKNGKVVKNQAYGIANIDTKAPMTVSHRFDMGSIGKTFTGTMILQEVEKGKISLDDPVSKFIRDWPAAWSKLTIRNLISHQSGLPEYVLLPDIGLLDSFTMDKWRESMYSLPLDFAPGTAYQYSNTNFVVLGLILEKLTGTPYAKLAKERIFDPAGMRNTDYRTKPKELPAGSADGYFWEDKWISLGTGGVSPVPADGGAMTTTEDLHRFAQAIASGKLIRPATVNMAQTASLVASGRRTGYGLGWMAKTLNDSPVNYHGGNSVGFSGVLASYPKQKLEIYMLCNLYPVGGDGFADGLAQVLDPTLRAKPLPAIKDPSPDRTKELLAALRELAAGKPEAPIFSEEMKARLNTPRGKMALPPFAVFKDAAQMEYVGYRKAEVDEVYRYRVTAGTATWILEFSIDRKGKIFSIGRSADPGSGR